MASTPSKTPLLYSYWRSSCSWRVRIALNFKQIPYDIKPISIISNNSEQHSAEYKKVNPMEQVPALIIDGLTLIESLSIMEYLEETRPQIPLLPKDFVLRAKVRELCQIVASGIQPLQNLKVLLYLQDDKREEWAKNCIHRGFIAVEKILASSAGLYCVGDDITLADVCLVPQIYNARRFHVDMNDFPIITRIENQLKEHPAFKATHPDGQPDCPNK